MKKVLKTCEKWLKAPRSKGEIEYAERLLGLTLVGLRDAVEKPARPSDLENVRKNLLPKLSEEQVLEYLHRLDRVYSHIISRLYMLTKIDVCAAPDTGDGRETSASSLALVAVMTDQAVIAAVDALKSDAENKIN
jgi:hypothetical protein